MTIPSDRWEVVKGNHDSERVHLNKILDSIGETIDALPYGLGSVTSVAISGTDGIEVDSGSPITTAGTIQLGLSTAVLNDLADAQSAVQPGDNVSVLVNDAGYTTNTGDVVGPASAVNNRVVFFDGVTGKLIKDSGLTLSGSNTGDQTSIVGITGSLAEFNAALTGADFATGGGTATGTNTGDQTITLTGDVTGSGTGSFATTLTTAQPGAHTWALTQTFTLAPVFTDQSGTRTALGLGTMATEAAASYLPVAGGTMAGDIFFSDTNFIIRANTADGSDTLQTGIAAGGTTSVGRGAFMILYGNDHATNAGELNLFSGNAVGAQINLNSLTNFAVAPTFTNAAGTRTNLGLGTAATQNTGTSGATLPFLNGANTWASTNSFTGLVTVTDIVLDKAAGLARSVGWRTGGVNRWLAQANATAEGGGNTGSDWTLLARDDAGSAIGTAIIITRATMAMTLGGVLSLSGTAADGTNSVVAASTAYAMKAAPNASYRTILDSSGSHIAGRVAGTYGMGQGDPLAITGTGTLYPLNVIYIDPNDYPTVNSLTTKLRVRCVVNCNDVAPTGNYTIALHPVTRPAASGGAGLCTYTVGAAVAGSGVTVTTPAADSQNNAVGADFAIPAAGFYVIGVVTTATVAASAHMHFSAQLQMRNT